MCEFHMYLNHIIRIYTYIDIDVYMCIYMQVSCLYAALYIYMVIIYIYYLCMQTRSIYIYTWSIYINIYVHMYSPYIYIFIYAHMHTQTHIYIWKYLLIGFIYKHIENVAVFCLFKCGWMSLTLTRYSITRGTLCVPFCLPPAHYTYV